MACLCPLPPDVDSGYYTVKFESLLLKEAVLEGDSVLPPLRAERAGSSDSDSGDEGDEGDASYAKGVATSRGPRSQRGGEGQAWQRSPWEAPGRQGP